MELTAFQALVTGAISGCLMKQDFMTIEVEIGRDPETGDYTNEITVTGLESGEKLRVTVDVAEPLP